MGESFGLGKTCSVGFEPADAHQYGAKAAIADALTVCSAHRHYVDSSLRRWLCEKQT